MDRRTLLFIFCVTLSFVIINAFFTYRHEQEKNKWQKEHPNQIIKSEVEQHQKEKTSADNLIAKETKLTNQKVKEEFFVLENEYQQLVFSNYGASLVEINLPFHSKNNQKSIVKEIDLDRIMKENYPEDSYFPSRSFYRPIKTEDNSFQKYDIGQLGGYYPLLRRDLIDEEDDTTEFIKPKYYALNIVSEYPELANLVYEVKTFTKEQIVFEAVQPYRRITKTFLIRNGNTPYCVDVAIKIEGDRNNLWLTSGIPEVELMSGMYTPYLKYQIMRNGKAEVEKISIPKESTTVGSVYPSWISNSNGFFGLIMDPSKMTKGYKIEKTDNLETPSRLSIVKDPSVNIKKRNFPGYNVLIPLEKPLEKSTEINFRYYAGPFSKEIFKEIDNYYAKLDENPKYKNALTFFGWFSFISAPFAKFLSFFLTFFHKITHSWAISIILLTFVLRLLLYPLNSWSMKSARRMQKIAPKISAIQAKYKKTPKKAQIEILNLYKKEKANPFTGCLPILIQMPFLIGMFDLLKSSFSLRGATFIPGWIDNLTAPDVLFSWNTPLPIIGCQFHLLPILLGAIMYLQQKIVSSLPKDKNLITDQQKQQQMMGRIMVAFFTIMFYRFPSGLNIYWLSSMSLGILQQWIINKKLDKNQVSVVKSSENTKNSKQDSGKTPPKSQKR